MLWLQASCYGQQHDGGRFVLYVQTMETTGTTRWRHHGGVLATGNNNSQVISFITWLYRYKMLLTSIFFLQLCFKRFMLKMQLSVNMKWCDAYVEGGPRETQFRLCSESDHGSRENKRTSRISGTRDTQGE